MKVISVPNDIREVNELLNRGYSQESISKRYRADAEDIAKEYQLLSRLKGNSNIVYCDDLRCVAQTNGYGWNLCIKMELLTPMQSVLCNPMQDLQVIDLGMDVCTALIACQKANILHRDIKPDNIMVSPDGNFKLTDFGVAKVAERTAGGTKTGTYNFMAPEVYNNQAYGHSADQYSLGMVMYWMLNNRCGPFLPQPPQIPTASQMEAAKQRRFSGEGLPEPVNGSPELKRIVMKACAYNPSNRFASPKAMYDALAKLMYGGSGSEESKGGSSNGAYCGGGSPDGAYRFKKRRNGDDHDSGTPDGAYRMKPKGSNSSDEIPNGAYRSGKKSGGANRGGAASWAAQNAADPNARTQGNSWDATEEKTSGGWGDSSEATKPGGTVGADPNLRKGPVKPGNLDVARTLKITAAEAVAGCYKQVISGTGQPVNVKIPAGSKDGKIIPVPGAGKQDPATGIRGSLIVTLRVDKTAEDFWQKDKKAATPPVQEKKPDNAKKPQTQAAEEPKRSTWAWLAWIITGVGLGFTFGFWGIVGALAMLFLCAVGEECIRDGSGKFIGGLFIFAIPIAAGVVAGATFGIHPGLAAGILILVGIDAYSTASMEATNKKVQDSLEALEKKNGKKK